MHFITGTLVSKTLVARFRYGIHSKDKHVARSATKSDARNEPSEAVIAQLVARRSHNPKVVSSILTHRIFLAALI